MRNLIANDISRCTNKRCTIKESCARYVQNHIDCINKAIRVSFTGFRQEDDGTCNNYISTNGKTGL